jgi:hypothetical protein
MLQLDANQSFSLIGGKLIVEVQPGILLAAAASAPEHKAHTTSQAAPLEYPDNIPPTSQPKSQLQLQ